MDEGELQRAQEWFRDQWHYGECPVCGVEDWEIQPNLGQIENLAVPAWGNLVSNGRVPALLVTCQNCGHFLTINAIVAGVRVPGEGGLLAEGEEDAPGNG